MTDEYEMVKSGSEAGWKFVWENVVLPETRNPRNADLMRKYGITRGDVMGLLYKEMIGDRKIDTFRNDGGSLWGWMRALPADTSHAPIRRPMARYPSTPCARTTKAPSALLRFRSRTSACGATKCGR